MAEREQKYHHQKQCIRHAFPFRSISAFQLHWAKKKREYFCSWADTRAIKASESHDSKNLACLIFRTPSTTSSLPSWRLPSRRTWSSATAWRPESTRLRISQSLHCASCSLSHPCCASKVAFKLWFNLSFFLINTYRWNVSTLAPANTSAHIGRIPCAMRELTSVAECRFPVPDR